MLPAKFFFFFCRVTLRFSFYLLTSARGAPETAMDMARVWFVLQKTPHWAPCRPLDLTWLDLLDSFDVVRRVPLRRVRRSRCRRRWRVSTRCLSLPGTAASRVVSLTRSSRGELPCVHRWRPWSRFWPRCRPRRPPAPGVTMALQHPRLPQLCP